MREIMDATNSFQAVRYAEMYMKYHEPKRTWETDVYWFWGKTGTGKSRTAHEMAPDAHVCTDNMKFWCGYDRHEDVIVDDFRPHMIPSFARLLQLTDRYPCKIEIKGHVRQFVPKRIIITSPYHPDMMFARMDDDTRQQLTRRIKEIREFPSVSCVEVEGNTIESSTSNNQ